MIACGFGKEINPRYFSAGCDAEDLATEIVCHKVERNFHVIEKDICRARWISIEAQ